MFKIGDKLKQIYSGNNSNSIGEIITIKKFNPPYGYRSIDSLGRYNNWSEDYLLENFELVKPLTIKELNKLYLSQLQPLKSQI